MGQCSDVTRAELVAAELDWRQGYFAGTSPDEWAKAFAENPMTWRGNDVAEKPEMTFC
jgi:hypothetical protein